MQMKRDRLMVVAAGVAFAAAVLWMSGPQTTAQSSTGPDATKTAVVNVSKVFTEYERSKQANDQLRKHQEQIEAKLKDMRDRIEALQAELANFNPESKDYFERQEKLLNLTVEFDVYKKVRVEETAREMRQMTEEIYAEILATIEELAKEQGYDLVLFQEDIEIKSEKLAEVRDKIMQRKVLYASSQINLTDTVLNQLNQSFRLKQSQQ